LGFLPLLEQGRVAGGAEAVKALVGIGVGAHRGEAGELAADEDLAVTAFLAIFTGGAEATAGAAGHPFFAAGQGFLVYVLAFRAIAPGAAFAPLARLAGLYGNPDVGGEGGRIHLGVKGNHADHHIAPAPAVASRAAVAAIATPGRRAVEQAAGILAGATGTAGATGAAVGENLEIAHFAGVQAQVDIHPGTASLPGVAAVAALAGAAHRRRLVL